ncbi:MAG: HigA family addiction module antitoxin [Spirochaetota bacterium]|nr:HigA family addiction module antitoxin [Spirochaetota bacterium]
MIREDFMPDYKLTVSRQTVNELIRETRSLSPLMALRLSRLFGNSAEFWLGAQRKVDLWDADQADGHKLEGIKPLVVG